MIGEVHVMEPEAYQRWLEGEAQGGAAQQGRMLFSKLQCITCHTADPTEAGPVLEGLYGKRIPLDDGSTALADESYIRESIRYPNARIVAGHRRPSIMPAFSNEQVNEEELLQVIAYLRSLKPGQTPPRVEEGPRPVPTSPEAEAEQRKEEKK